VVFGGQILAQTVVAASDYVSGKEIKSLHTIFARGASPDRSLEIDVEPLQDGHSFSSLSISASQGDRLCTRAVALLHDAEADLIRHGDSRRVDR
jgi:acyl-CoA thioesterase II